MERSRVLGALEYRDVCGKVKGCRVRRRVLDARWRTTLGAAIRDFDLCALFEFVVVTCMCQIALESAEDKMHCSMDIPPGTRARFRFLAFV